MKQNLSLKFKDKSLIRGPKIFSGLSFYLIFILLSVLVFRHCSLVAFSENDKIEQRKVELRSQLESLRQQIDQYQLEITRLHTEAKTLQREISLMESQIRKIELQIEQGKLAISELELLIEQKTTEVVQVEKDIESRKALLAEYLRAVYLYDRSNLMEIVLSTENFSEFFERIQALEVIQAALRDNLNTIAVLKKNLQDEKQALEAEKEEQQSLQALQEIQQITLLNQRQAKQTFLSQTKGEESIFRQLAQQTQQNIGAIRNQLYLLEGVGVSLSLAEAVERAEKVCQVTGVRPAFLLAVLKQESSWGKNVGKGSWQRDMSPRDKDAFLEICNRLGFDPDKMPVSGKPWYGWGGAMGPAQFLPTTWLAYEVDVARVTGHNPPSPWNLEDAFAAAALKLARDGASTKTYETEWKAAMIYFAGSRWNNPLYAFYGDSVMNVAQVIQEQIDFIQG